MPDFGIFRGFNDKLFGDKLYAGQLPINLGLIGSTDFSGIDPDAQAFFDRVAAATGVLSATEKTAINTLVKQMKLDGTWTKMKAIYPMVGASAAACRQNLRSSSFTGTFTSGWTFASTGVTPNGTSAYMDTGIACEIDVFGKDLSISFYSRTDSIGLKADIGNFGNLAINSNSIYTNLSGEIYLDIPNEQVRIRTLNTNTRAFFLINNSINIGRTIFRNSSKILNSSFSNNNLHVATNPNLMLSSTYSGDRCSDREIALASFGISLTDNESSNFYTAVQAFQTTLSRQV